MNNADAEHEAGSPTVWDNAWREGYAKAIENLLGLRYRHAWLLSRDHWRPWSRRRVALARFVLRPPSVKERAS